MILPSDDKYFGYGYLTFLQWSAPKGQVHYGRLNDRGLQSKTTSQNIDQKDSKI